MVKVHGVSILSFTVLIFQKLSLLKRIIPCLNRRFGVSVRDITVPFVLKEYLFSMYVYPIATVRYPNSQ